MRRSTPSSRSRAKIPFKFVIDHLSSRSPKVKVMFGAHMVYVGDKMVFFLIEKENNPGDNGICLATKPEHHASLTKQFPSLRPLETYGPEGGDWLLLPQTAEDFETAAITACELVVEGDSRIGKTPIHSQEVGLEAHRKTRISK